MHTMPNCSFCHPEEKIADWGWLLAHRYYWATPINPVTPGHTLIIPAEHIPLAHIRPGITARVFEEAARWAGSRELTAYNLIQSNGLAATQSVDHLHVHVVPRHSGDNLPLPWTPQQEALKAASGPQGRPRRDDTGVIRFAALQGRVTKPMEISAAYFYRWSGGTEPTEDLILSYLKAHAHDCITKVSEIERIGR